MNIGFYDLPKEVISYIFTGLDNQSLARCCSVSQLFHQIAWEDALFRTVISNTIRSSIPNDDIRTYVNDHFALSRNGLLKQVQKFVDLLKLGDNATLICHYPYNPDLTLDCLWNSTKNRQEKGASSDNPATILFCLSEASDASLGVSFRIRHQNSKPILRSFKSIASFKTIGLDSIEYKCELGFRNKRKIRQDIRLFKKICAIFAKKAAEIEENLYQEKKKIFLENEAERIAYHICKMTLIIGFITCIAFAIFIIIQRAMDSRTDSIAKLPPSPPCGQWSWD